MTQIEITDPELNTILAALRFWQRHGPKVENSFYDRCEQDEQDFLDDIRSNGGKTKDLSIEQIDDLCEKINKE